VAVGRGAVRLILPLWPVRFDRLGAFRSLGPCLPCLPSNLSIGWGQVSWRHGSPSDLGSTLFACQQNRGPPPGKMDDPSSST